MKTQNNLLRYSLQLCCVPGSRQAIGIFSQRPFLANRLFCLTHLSKKTQYCRPFSGNLRYFFRNFCPQLQPWWLVARSAAISLVADLEWRLLQQVEHSAYLFTKILLDLLRQQLFLKLKKQKNWWNATKVRSGQNTERNGRFVNSSANSEGLVVLQSCGSIRSIVFFVCWRYLKSILEAFFAHQAVDEVDLFRATRCKG